MKRIFLVAITVLTLLLFAACSSNTQEGSQEDDVVVSNEQDAQTSLRNRNRIQGFPSFTSNWNDAPRAHAFWSLHENIEALVERAGDIVRVEVLDQRSDLICMFMGEVPPDVDDPYLAVTVYRIRVLEVFQGEAQPGEILEIMQTGTKEDEWQPTIQMAPIAPGDDVVVFLLPRGDYADGFIGMMNPFQSVYRFPAISEDARIMSVDMDEALENVVPEDESYENAWLSLTLDDLANLQIENYGQVSESFEALLR